MEKKLEDYDFFAITADEARTLGPFGKNDYPATVTCRGRKETWRSAKAATAFYEAGAAACDGSEHDRYAALAAKLKAGNRNADDSVWGWR